MHASRENLSKGVVIDVWSNVEVTDATSGKSHTVDVVLHRRTGP